MPPKSVNSKKAAAMEKKAANEEAKAARKAAADEQKEAASWADGADARGAKRQAELERKRQEADAKRAEKAALMEQEEAMAAGAKPKVKKPAGKGGAKAANDLKELEAQLRAMELEKKKKEEKKKAAAAATKAKKKAEEEEGSSSDDDGLPPLEANPNRMLAGVEQARTVEAAIDLLGGGAEAGGEKHPEKRQKAAYKAYEERMLAELKQEMPGLKLSQYKERIFAMWQKAPENPIVQAKAAGLR